LRSDDDGNNNNTTNSNSNNNSIKTHPEGFQSHAVLTWTPITACSVHPHVLLPLHGPTSKLFHFQTNREKKNQNIEQISRGPTHFSMASKEYLYSITHSQGLNA